MFKNIIKRDGRIVPFDPEKITIAISKAGKATGEFDYDTAKRLTIKVLLLAEELIRDRDPHVEEIQDIVEEILLSSPYRKTAKAYIIYRDQHARMREIARQGGLELIDNYLSKVDWRISENSNMSFSLQGLNNYISSEISKSYWLHKIYPPEVREAHINGDMHIHDLNALSAYCVGWDLMDLLIRGFGGVPGKVESLPAKHLRPALGQIVNFLYTTQGECYSSDTQVLTYSGWKYFFELTEHDFIFTMNTETKKIELQKPVKFYEFDYNGAMYHFKSKKLDLLVTPNHRMLVQQYSPTSKDNGKLKFIEAEKFNPNTHFIPKHALWEGRIEEYFILPEIKIYQYRNFKKINSKSESPDILEEEAGIYSSQPIEKYEIKVLPPKKIPMNLWLKFFGFWLAEGCTYLRKRQRKGREVPYYEYLVRISQKKSEIAEEFEKVLSQIPFSYNKKFKADLIEFYINDKQLFSYLRKFGKSCDKFIPSEIKNLSKEQLEIIFDWLMKGDGWSGDGNIEYSTKSKRLADDIQEIVLKLGMSANIYERKKGNFKWYDVGVFLAKNFRLNSVNKQVTNYAGKVYCVEVPNHTLYVRRNGKACWCGNSAGAQAFSNVDTLLAPFIAYDGLNYKQVKQALQEWVFNLNVPTRVGFQCLSEDTEILTLDGWKRYNEVEIGDSIYTFNINNGEIETKLVTYVFRKEYSGIMYNLKNRSQSQLISPNHRVVRKVFNTEKYRLDRIEDLLSYSSPLIIPVAGENKNPDYPISDEELKLLSWILSEGSIEREGSHRVSIYQSKETHPENYEEIIQLLEDLNFEYTVKEQHSLGKCEHIRLKPKSSKAIHELIGAKIKKFPEYLYRLSKRQARLFLETYLKGDGWTEKFRKRITVTEEKAKDFITAIAVLAGYNFNVKKRKMGGISKKLQYIITLTETKADHIMKIEKIEYRGIIWSVHTENETVIARRNGQVFITGNTPFSNITLDLKVPEHFASQAVIIGGKPQEATYGEFQREMDIFNQALFEVLSEGDAKGRVFTFPIPTINITKDFNWNSPVVDLIMQATAKYGIPYFANYVNSDLRPEDARSMCCRLRLETKELKHRGGGLFGSNPLTGCYDEETEILTKKGWKFFKELTMEDEVFTLTKDNRIEIHKPKKIYEYDYEGLMIHFKAKSLDLLVTPNHRMVVDQVGSNKRKFVEAKDFDFNNHRIPKQGIWEGEEREYFEIPPVTIMGGSGPESRFSEEEIKTIRIMKKEGKSIYQISAKLNCNPVTIHNICTKENYGNRERLRMKFETETLRIQMDDWLKFFGFWLAEGCTDNEKNALRHGYRVTICQVNDKTRKEFIEVLDRMPFSYYLERYNIIICNKQLWSYLKQFGNKYQKFIPEEIKNLSKRQLKILFDWIVKGDGHVRKKTGQITYWTASRRLAEDLQEVILKLGWLGTFKTSRKKVSHIKGRKINAGIVYTIGVQKAKHYRLRENNIEQIYYKGKVYCCEVPNHTVFVRRKGKVSWCGNSIGVVTINLPRIGYLSNIEEEFIDRLLRLMDIAKTSLEIKRKVLERFTEAGLYPYSRHYLSSVKERTGAYWCNHFSTIGIIGMNEAIANARWLNSKGIWTEEGKAFALKVMDFMREKLLEYQKETGNLYNLEATPAEGTSYRLARIDKQKYPDIITQGSEHPYYTNSTWLPVGFTESIHYILDNQDELQSKYTGGTVQHIFLGEKPEPQKLKRFIRQVFEKYTLPYISITPTFSVCSECGYIEGEHSTCPKCGRECEIYSRVVGYLRPVSNWNEGKKEEFKDRKYMKEL
ncbi:anaerobic ribonucleoside-triphosphate reductase [Thermodesulfovibrio yellowstonii]|uniref:Uncharacterized protein n=1 Tax=Thermodesulfovibrio yellowstonii TaxID=28262 RepID=A0A9W6GI74_9BACT|nr:anaerobic ribonucleoside-triphosphate reductase [Thermodesulfovibrio islandicus]GLI54132.1 hypothetical protein TISLANDTSLP1_18250 [Thermodesulfovibrio islandicus]